MSWSIFGSHGIPVHLVQSRVTWLLSIFVVAIALLFTVGDYSTVLATCPSTISYGDTVECSIASTSQVDEYTLTGSDGDAVVLLMTTMSSDLDPKVSLTRPNGSVLCSTSSSAGDDGRWIEVSIGCVLDGTTAIVKATSLSGSGTGDYRVSLLKKASGPSLAYGDTVSGSLASGEAATLTFSGSSGDRAYIKFVTDTDDDINTFFRVFRPNGQLYCGAGGPDLGYGNSSNHYSDMACPLIDSGTHTLLIERLPGDTSVDYFVHIQRTNSPVGATSTGYGQTKTGSLDQGEVKAYTFTGHTGDVINYELDPAYDPYNVHGMVFPPGGGSSFCLNVLENCTLHADGTYTILVSSYEGIIETDYTFTLNGLTSAYDPKSPTASACPFQTYWLCHPDAWSPDPVNLATGDFEHVHTDIQMPTPGIGLAFTRTYHSGAPEDGPLGYGWTHNYDMHTETSGSDIYVYHPDGHAVLYTYSAGDFLAPSGVLESLTYDSLDDTFTMTTQGGMRFVFGEADGSIRRLAAILDRNDNQVDVTYDEDGRLDRVAAQAGTPYLQFGYDGESTRIETIEDSLPNPDTRTVAFHYDENGDLTSVKDVGSDPAEGPFTEYTYDEDHRMLTLTDVNGHSSLGLNVYDSAGRVVEQHDALDQITCFHYGYDPTYSSNCPEDEVTPSNNQTVVYDPLRHAKIYTYDSRFRLSGVTDANWYQVGFQYNSDNQLTCISDQLGRFTALEYDENGNLALRTEGDDDCVPTTYAAQWQYSYDENNDLTQVIDPNGSKTNYVHDDDGSLTRVVRMDDEETILMLTCYEHEDGDGLVTAVVESTDLELPEEADDPCTGHRTEFEYDANGSPSAVTDARFTGQVDPPQTIIDADDAGRVLSITDELAHSREMTYSNAGLPLTLADELGHTTSNSYDAKGNLISVMDPNRQQADATSELDVDGCGTLGTGDGVDDDSGDSDGVADDGCPNTVYEYDAADRLVKVVDAWSADVGGAPVTTYAYDAVGHLIAATEPNRQAIGATSEADIDGCGTSGTGDGIDDDTGDSDGIADDGCPSTIYAYDSVDKLHTVTDALGNVTSYEYDEAYNLRERVDARGLITDYTPDALNRLDTIEYWDETHSNMLSSVDYDYDPAGNRIQMIDSTGTTTYTPDALNRLQSVTFPGSVTVSYGYDEVGDRTSMTYPSTDEVDYTYDEGHRMETVTDWLSQQTVYHYDDAGRLDYTELPNGVTTDYNYDDGNRLTDVESVGPGPTTVSDVHYELDSAGNRTEMTDLSGASEYVYDSLNRLVEVTYPDPETDAYTYDANGNRLGLDSIDYTYNAANQMLTADGVSYVYDEDGNQIERGDDTFEYDHENRLVEAVTGDVTSTSGYNGDGLRVSVTVDNGSPVTTDYVWDVNGQLPVVLDDGSNQYVYGLGLISATDGVDNQLYYISDGLGSTTALTDDTGAATDTYSYDVFGTVRDRTGTTENSFDFTGQQTDADSALQFLRARYYDPGTGRFITRDPITGDVMSPVTQNRYVYAGQNPTRWTDPRGTCFGLGHCPVIDDAADCVSGLMDCVKDAGGGALSIIGSDDFTVAACTGGGITNPLCQVSLLVNDHTRPYIINGIQILDMAPLPEGINAPVEIAAFLASEYQILSNDCLSNDQKNLLTQSNIGNLGLGLIGGPFATSYEWANYAGTNFFTTCGIAEAPGTGSQPSKPGKE